MSEADPLLNDTDDNDTGALFPGLRRNWLLVVGGAALTAALAWIVYLFKMPCHRTEPGVARAHEMVSASCLFTGSLTAPCCFMILSIVAASFAAGLLLLSFFVFSQRLFRKRPSVSAGKKPVAEVAGTVERRALNDEPMLQVDRRQRWSAPVEQEIQTATSETSIQSRQNPNGVEQVANCLLDARRKRVIVVSPEGDQGSAGSVRLSRELADRGKRVIFIDMTAFGIVSAAMLDGHLQVGITDLLAGKCRFNEVIHSDRFSTAHVIPLGNTDPALAMRSADRLPLILDALETVYDFAVIECGPCSSAQIRQIADRAATIVMSIVDPDNNAVAISALDLDQNGFEDVIILMDDIAI